MSGPVSTLSLPTTIPHKPTLHLTPYHPSKIEEKHQHYNHKTIQHPNDTASHHPTNSTAKSQLAPTSFICGHTQPHISYPQYDLQYNATCNPNTQYCNHYPVPNTTSEPHFSHHNTPQHPTQKPLTVPKLQPINWPTICPINVCQPDPTLCSTNYITDNYPVPSHCTTPSKDETTNPALITWHTKNCQFSPTTTKDLQVSTSTFNSLLSKDPQNPFAALKEASSLNKKVN